MLARQEIAGENVGVQPYPHGELVIVLDCLDLARSAAFWSAALGYRSYGGADGPYLSLHPTGSGPELLLQRVPEPKVTKNCVHLDLRTPDLAAEVARVVEAGATVLTSEPVEEDGWRWHILADPDGNELCVLQPPPGR